jgi:thymidylate synthase (FAD)
MKILDHGEVVLQKIYGSEQDIVSAARTSYQKSTKKTSDDVTLLNYLIRHQHTSPLEFAEVVFYVKAPLFVSTQHLRHRTWNFSFESLRYSEAKEEIYKPLKEDITSQSKTNKQGGSSTLVNWDRFSESYVLSKEVYSDAIKHDVRRELARSVLPVSQYTSYFCKVDLNNFLRFLKLRLSFHAQYEIRVYAEAMRDLVKPSFPNIFKAWEDAVLNCVSFSEQEFNLLAETFTEEQKKLITEKALNISNKRQRQEFLNKILK